MKVETITKYIADDGKEFDTKTECRNHEIATALGHELFLSDFTPAQVEYLVNHAEGLAEIFAKQVDNGPIVTEFSDPAAGPIQTTYKGVGCDFSTDEHNHTVTLLLDWVHQNWYLVPKPKTPPSQKETRDASR